MFLCSRRPADRLPVVPCLRQSIGRCALPFLACAAVTAGDPAASQTVAPGTSRLDPVAVTASRQSQPIADVLADLTVIGPEEIARAGVQSLTELLQRQPGVEIVQNGGPGSVSGVFLRGANSGQTLVLIDGVRISSSTTGATTLAALPLDQIERIEVLRGPASSLYGADAIGGVIQVFTRQGGGAVSGNASAGYGTYNTWDVKGGVGGSVGAVTFAVQAAATESNGFNTITNPANFFYNPDTDGYSSQSVSANAGVTFAPGQEARAQYFRSRLDNQFDGGPDYDDRTITIAETWQVQSRNRLASFWVSQLSAAQSTDDSQTQTGDGSFPFQTTQRQYTWQNEFALPRGALTAGYERREERVATNLAFATTSRDTDSVFGIYQLRVDAQAVQANLRYDESSQYGGETTGAIAYSYRPSPSWRLTAGYSTGFKAPSFNDLYFPGYANPNLAPETSRNVEGGVYWNGTVAGASVEARAIGYRNRISELIVFQCDAVNCAPQNVDRAALDGVTLGAEVRTSDGATIAASLDVQSPQNDLTGKLLPRRARQHGALAVGCPVGPARVGLEVVASSLRYDDAENEVKMGGYAIVNLTAEWVLGRDMSLFARANNVLDKNYELAAGYATGGATVFAGVRAQFR
jgi:vitamin B12 transporter